MHAMQYDITLPADYDMEIIRDRVRTRGHLLDGAEGLAFKVYGIRERGKNGSPVNEYAPFYLWDRSAALTGMLRGPGFRGLSADFGRPPVRTWHVLGRHEGPSYGARLTTAERRITPLGEGEDVGERTERALAELREVAGRPGIGAAVLGLDPYRWELVRFLLREGTPSAPSEHVPGETADAPGETYEILRLSLGAAAPALGAAP